MSNKSYCSNKLSIITINYNNYLGLKSTGLSIVNQTCKNFEWIIIDGSSDDGSQDVIKEFNAYVTKWISEKDEGIYNAMNKGINLSTGKYLLFLNSGDLLYDNNTIMNVIPFLNNKDFFVGFEKSIFGIKGLESSNKDYLLKTLINSSLPHQAIFIKRTVFNKLGLYNENLKLISDWWLLINAVLNNSSFSILPFIVCIYDQNGLSVKNYDIVLKEKNKLLKIIINNYKFNLKIKFRIYSQLINNNKTLFYLKYISRQKKLK